MCIPSAIFISGHFRAVAHTCTPVAYLTFVGHGEETAKDAADKYAEACKKFGLPPGCCVRWCLLEGPSGGYRLAVGGKSQPQKGDGNPKKRQQLVCIPPQWEDDEEVAADVIWPVCVVPGKTSFTNKDDAVQALKNIHQRHKDEGVGKEDNANDKVTDPEASGGGDEPDEDGIAESSGAGDPSHAEGMKEPNGDGEGDAGKMNKRESPPKADEGMVHSDKEEGTKKVDQPMEEGEQGGEEKPKRERQPQARHPK